MARAVTAPVRFCSLRCSQSAGGRSQSAEHLVARIRWRPEVAGVLQTGEGGDKGRLVGGAEEGSARHKGVGACGAAFRAGDKVDATVDLQSELQAAFAPPRVELAQLRQHVAAKSLPAETRLHGHDEYQVDLGQQRFDGGRRSVRIENDSVLTAEFADASQGRGMIVGGFDVDADQVGSGPGEGIEVAVRFIQHQMRVEEQRGSGATQGGQGFWAEGEIGYEVPIHQIEMQPLGTGVGNDPRAGGQVGVIAGKQRGGENGSMHERRREK